ncbi:hypothetical protein ACSMXN_06385 [Jatrophihabitans sp. DSM 45814]
MSEVTQEQLEDIEALFVQSAGSLSSDGEKTITLHGLSPSTIYFADRPQREVGHISTRRFIELWGQGEDSFAIDPPNAVVSFAEPRDRMPEEVVVTIRDPHMDGDSLTYQVTVLEGTLPVTTGPCALFVDPFGRPLSPVSAAGMHRRARRRARR